MTLVPNRRSSLERRGKERRQSSRYTDGTLIIVDGMTWIDDQGNDRRNGIRRLVDRERVIQRILDSKQ